MSEMHEVVIDSLRISLTNAQRVLLLKDRLSEQFIPIWIGAFEAESIIVALQKIEVSRPQTHDLLRNVITTLGGRLKQIELSKIQNETFFACLVIEAHGETLRIDCRPSDAIAIATRCHVPMFVAQEVFETAAIVEEVDIRQTGTQSRFDEMLSSGPETNDGGLLENDHLAVFADFLQNISLSDEEDGADDGDRGADAEDDKDEAVE